jgi:hypothetical protein
MEEFKYGIEFASNDDNSSVEIFKIAQNCSYLTLLGILDGVILRSNDNLVKGFLKQFEFIIEDLESSSEHAKAFGRMDYVNLINKHKFITD